jgi:hypothetical protein
MPTKKELYERAGELGIAARDKMTKSALEEAIAETEAKGNPVNEPTQSQKHAAQGKGVEELAADTASEDPRVVEAAQRELEKRNAAAKNTRAERGAHGGVKRAPVQNYLVVKGCLVNSNGMLTELAEGSVVSAMTHNLNTLRRSGAELKPVKGSRVAVDQFGSVSTEVIE